MLLISAGMKAVSGLGQGLFGLMRKKEGEGMIPGDRPQMTMPASMDEMVDLFKGSVARTKLPGQDILIGDIKGGTAGGIQAALETGPGSMGAITQMVGQEQEAIAGLGVPLAQMRYAAEGQLGRALSQRAGTEQEMEEWNKIQAWKEKYYEGMRRKEQGIEDISSGFSSLSAAGGLGIFGALAGSQTGESDVEGEKGGDKDILSWLKEIFLGGSFDSILEE